MPNHDPANPLDSHAQLPPELRPELPEPAPMPDTLRGALRRRRTARRARHATAALLALAAVAAFTIVTQPPTPVNEPGAPLARDTDPISIDDPMFQALDSNLNLRRAALENPERWSAGALFQGYWPSEL